MATPLYHVRNPLTGHLYQRQRASAAPVGFAPPSPALEPCALRLPVARMLVRLLARHHGGGLVVVPAGTAAAPPGLPVADAAAPPCHCPTATPPTIRKTKRV